MDRRYIPAGPWVPAKSYWNQQSNRGPPVLSRSARGGSRSRGVAMRQTDPPSAGWRFGVFEVDLQTGELTKRGMRLRLQEQPFRLLAILLEKPGELVTREELSPDLAADVCGFRSRPQ